MLSSFVAVTTLLLDDVNYGALVSRLIPIVAGMPSDNSRKAAPPGCLVGQPPCAHSFISAPFVAASIGGYNYPATSL